MKADLKLRRRSSSSGASDALAKAPRGFRRALLRWYDAHRRDLPWRKTRNPYRIWLAEIMLQQTRVAAVLEHYRRFLESFPNVQKLADAPESAVLAAWSGLGYYRRARMLRQCAQKVVREHGGRFPESLETLRELPGIGRYTAAAIASIAFGEPAAVVDGNVERVLQRVAGRELAAKEIWDLAQTVLEKSRPGDFNQAMMELGATVCLPRGPKCAACPVRRWCATRGEQPREAASVRQVKKETWSLLEQQDGHVRLLQRSRADSLMAGMWELPEFVPKPAGVAAGLRFAPDGAEPPPHTAADSRNALRKKTASLTHWRTFRHSITDTDYTVHVVRRRVIRKANGARGKWIAASELAHVPITGLTRKVLRAAGII